MLVTDPRDTQAQAEQLIGVAVQLAECTAEGDRKPTECPRCFAPGTPVHERGGIVPIEEVKEGDEVLAYDPKTGKNEYRPVTALTPAHLDSTCWDWCTRSNKPNLAKCTVPQKLHTDDYMNHIEEGIEDAYDSSGKQGVEEFLKSIACRLSAEDFLL